MKKIFRALTLCLVLLSLLCAAVPAAFAAGNKEDAFYTIGLDACGGVSSTVVVTTNLDGKLTTLPESPTMDGYTFNGWYTEPVGGSRITTATVFTGDTTIYAQWTAKSSSASPTTPTLPVTGGPALQKHLGTLLVAGILVTLVVVPACYAVIDENEMTYLDGGATIADSDAYKAFLNVGQVFNQLARIFSGASSIINNINVIYKSIVELNNLLGGFIKK